MQEYTVAISITYSTELSNYSLRYNLVLRFRFFYPVNDLVDAFFTNEQCLSVSTIRVVPKSLLDTVRYKVFLHSLKQHINYYVGEQQRVHTPRRQRLNPCHRAKTKNDPDHENSESPRTRAYCSSSRSVAEGGLQLRALSQQNIG